ncbi:MAG TPA: anti-sigma factor antagonist [Planctomycetaceae bacterium]|nr:anti-sigma factor antagonist [Planctomycetaceae bacterium]
MALLDIQEKNDVVVVYFRQAKILDESTIRQIGEEFKNLTIEAAASRKLLLNFERVEFMSSSMVGQIIRLNKQCKQDKVRLKLCGISPSIMEVFNLMRLRKVLEIHDDEEEALEAFGSGRRGWFGRR